MYHAFLIKYAEIGLKGNNRAYFEDCLVKQLRYSLRRVGSDYQVRKEPGRIFVECPDGFDYDDTVEAISCVFGVSGYCPVEIEKSTAWEDILAACERYIREHVADRNVTFKVFCKRGDKNYPKTSPEICADIGEHLLSCFPEMKVDVVNPQLSFTVEVRGRVYIYTDTYAGPGGMPVGCNGKAMLLLSGGIDSPVAGYMIAKRGVYIDATYFHAPPYTSERALQKVIDLARIIAKYTGPIHLNVVNFTEIQMFIYDRCPHDELTILMRRYMMRIAERIAKEHDCLALVTGESIGQVASQTMQSLNTTNAVCTLPVYRPLIAFDKEDIVAISKKIGTYETSILPFEDCCTIYVAKHPVTKPIVKAMEKSERLLADQIDEMTERALAERKVIRISPEDNA
ncbi:MAG: tRNA 4-thiouridine(8) synthase ThiI [Lachnospiraceae bacterium]|nr:tRNA 4-thiouridine(8) synthase ThiI [Lachnospiraceae bacterium]